MAHTHNTQHNTQKQDEPLPPYPQQVCPISPWQHLPWPQIMVPQLPTSLLQAPGSGFALAAGGFLGWDAKQSCIKKKREGGGSLALGGRRLVIRHNNQPIVGGSDMMDGGEDARQGWSVWRGCFSFFGAAN
jgi:hypothetical protein